MIFEFKCKMCGKVFEQNISVLFDSEDTRDFTFCPDCGNPAVKQFHATTNFHIPSYFHTSKSDIFSDTEWAALKKDPNVERV